MSERERVRKERDGENPINHVVVQMLNQGQEVRLIVPGRDNKPCNHPSLLHKPGNYLPKADHCLTKGRIYLTFLSYYFSLFIFLHKHEKYIYHEAKSGVVDKLTTVKTKTKDLMR